MARLSTHVVDTVKGGPAAGMWIALCRFDPESRPRHVTTVTTNADGRTDEPLLAGDAIAGSVAETVDATGCHVLPGVVDPHAHFNAPGRADWKGFESGSTACAAGGALFIDMLPARCTSCTCRAARAWSPSWKPGRGVST